MEIQDTHITAAEGKTLVRTSNNEVMGKEIYLGYTYYIGGEALASPIMEVAENFSEVDDDVAELLRYTYKAADGYDAIRLLYEARRWATTTESEKKKVKMEEPMTDEQKQRFVADNGIEATDYSALVTRFIRTKYSADDMEAIINNKLEGLYESEYTAMQQWRATAKELASDVMRVASLDTTATEETTTESETTESSTNESE